MESPVKKTYALLIFIAIFTSTLYAITTHPAAFDYTHTYDLTAADPNLTGEAVTIATLCRSTTYVDGYPQYDYLPNISHHCFANSNLNFYNDLDIENAISNHSTATLAVAAGHDSHAYHPAIGDFLYKGGSPNAELQIHEFWDFIRDNLYYQDDFNADIITISFGTFYQDWWTHGLGHLADKNQTLIIASIGNGYEAFDPLMFPAAAPNVLGVGVIDSIASSDLTTFSNANPATSSSGPTEDFRCGPDIVAPGNCLVPTSDSQTHYEQTGSWSSFAVPVVSSTAALLMQKAKQTPALQVATNPTVLRSILINSAKKLPYWHKGYATPDDDHTYSLDFTQGAGALDATAAYNQLIAGQQSPGQVNPTGFDAANINPADQQEIVYQLQTTGTKNQYITASLVFNRHYNNQFPFDLQPTQSDLRLELWAIDPQNPSRDYMLDYSDSPTDNIEHLHTLTDPTFTNYEIVILQQTQSPEDYAIAWHTATKDTQKQIGWYDINGDGQVNAEDYKLLLDRINKPIESNHHGYIKGDVDMSGKIEINDLIEILKYTTRTRAKKQ